MDIDEIEFMRGDLKKKVFFEESTSRFYVGSLFPM